MPGVGLAGVGGFPSLLGDGHRSREWLHPLTISNLIVEDDPQFFPLLDSRTRYWRYFVLRGPKEKLTPKGLRSLGRLLLRVLHGDARDPRGGRSRGIGALDFASKARAGKKVGPRDQTSWARRLERAYRSAALAFWGAAKADARAWEPLLRLHRALKHGRLDRFLDSSAMPAHGDGRARRAFFLLMRDQRAADGVAAEAVAADYARLFLRRPDWDVFAVLADAGWSSFATDAARRVYLARCLPRVLFRLPTQARVHDVEDDDGEEAVAGGIALAEVQRKLAKRCRKFLERGAERVRGRLTAVQVVRIVRLLSGALRSKPSYEEPLEAPPLPPGQSLQFLFPGLRLDSLARLLRDTRPR